MSRLAATALAILILTLCTDRSGRAQTAKAVPTLLKPIGITTAGGVFSQLIPAGQRLPYTHSETFGNATNGRGEVQVELAQKDAAGVEIIASLRIPIPKAANKTLDITVTLIVAGNKTMRVKTTVAQTASVKEFGPFPVT